MLAAANKGCALLPRGGHRSNTSNAGVFTANFNNSRSNTNTNIGARPDLEMRPKRHAHGHGDSTISKGCAFLGKTEILNRQRRSSSPARVTDHCCRQLMKTYTNLYPKIYDFSALYAAYMKTRKGKRHVTDVQKFEQDLEGNLIQIQNELIWQTYRVGEYRTFKVYEPKEREIAALPFRDRVVQHALMAVIDPIFDRSFIYDSYACRAGKGTHKGASRAQEMMRKVRRHHGRVYVLKSDVENYFHSINHEILKRLVRRKIRCRKTLWLVDLLIDSMKTGDRPGVGIHVGSLISQMLANLCLNELDNFVKHGLRERHYVRYMDDIVVVHHDKEHLHRVRGKIQAFLRDHLLLETHRKTQVFPVSMRHGRALDFLGYKIWVTHRKIRKQSIDRMRRRLIRLGRQYTRRQIGLKEIQQTVQSWIAHASHAQTYGLRKAVLGFKFTRGKSNE